MNSFIYGNARYEVTALQIQVRSGSRILMLETGAILPSATDPADIKRLLADGLIRKREAVNA